MSVSLTRHNRRQQVLDALEAENASLADADRTAKYAEMAESPYGFFRGTNHMFWQDFYNDWRFALFGGVPETATWLQGDAHVYNFGAFADHHGRVIYGLDDFDACLVGDFQYDLWRLAISIVLDCRENPKLSTKHQRKAVEAMGGAYFDELAAHEDGNPPWTATIDVTDGLLQKFLKKTAKKNDRGDLLDKWTRQDRRRGRVFAKRRLNKLKALGPDLREELHSALDAYQQTLEGRHADSGPTHFHVKDIARRLWAGTGSLGVDRFYALVEGDSGGADDDVILDVKEQTPPQPYRFMTEAERAEYDAAFVHEGERHATAFRALAEHPDAYLGWLEVDGKVFSVRERSPFKEDYPTEKLKKLKHYKQMARYWGRILACAHIRGSHSLLPNDPAGFATTVTQRVGARRERFFEVLNTLAFAYADCTTQDYHWFLDSALVTDRVEQLA